MSYFNKNHLLAGLALATVTAGAAHAETSILVTDSTFRTTKSEAVRIADLNLADTKARKTLDNRIAAATARVCDKSPTFGVRRQPVDYRRCAERASADAHAQVSQALAQSGAGTLRAAR